MKNFRSDAGAGQGDRLAEATRFGSYLICAMFSYVFTLVTAGVLIRRGSIDFDMDLIIIASLSGGLFVGLFTYFSAIKKRVIVIQILKLWTIVFLVLQFLTFIIALVVWLHYGVHNPALGAADSFLAAGLSLIGLFFGVFGLVRGIRHRWFEAVLLPR